ncbi:transporter substrate-binding domain-containing protein [Caenispirillum bisanense]|uniref:substrate-binding periplasmic protein n=1 Tax=Caenispirillum bisanense TaxID=414052 RepID=UPI0031DC708C
MRRLLGLLFCLGLAAAPAALAADRPEYVVGVEELDYYPVYAVQDGAYVGAAREILDAFAADAGVAFRYQPLPVNRLYADLTGGGIDFKFPDNPHWNPAAKAGADVVYSAPVIAYIDGVMVRPARKGAGPDAVATLGTVTGFTPFSWLDRIQDGRVRLSENAQMRPLLRQVMAERIDGAYVSVAVASHLLAADFGDAGALVFDAGLPHSRDDYRLSAARHPELIARFDAWLAANAERVAEIKARYGAERGVD